MNRSTISNINISANTLFHFTNSFAKLKSILKNGFYPQYTLEDYLGSLVTISYMDTELAIPAVCFCDIPLSHTEKHIELYGKYALGLSKDWAFKKRVNPVIYTYRGSDFANNLIIAFYGLVVVEVLPKERNINKIVHFIKTQPLKLSNHFLTAIQYIKPYEGRFWKKRGKIRFYDEREWKYIPTITEDRIISMPKKDFLNDKIRNKINKAIVSNKHIRLSFKPKDIKFIIVKNENEVYTMANTIKNIFKNKFSDKDIQILTTRIISMDFIRENF